MHRLFVALRPSAELRAQMLALTGGIDGARWQTDAQLHLTLRFIGEVERSVAEDIAVALSRIDRPVPKLVLTEPGTFGRPSPHSLWIGAASDPALILLHRKVERALQGAGLPPEHRTFVPHITIARLNRSTGPIAPWLARAAALRNMMEESDTFGLFESRLSAAGAHYTEVARYPVNLSQRRRKKGADQKADP